VADPSCYSRSKITEDGLKDRGVGLLKNVAGAGNIAGTFSASRRPREVQLRVVCHSSNRVLLSSSRVDFVSFMQINPENYKSRPPLPEDVPLAHTDASVDLTSFVLHFVSDGLLNPRLISCISFAGPSASRTASDVQDWAADEPAVDSGRTRKQRAASAGSNDR